MDGVVGQVARGDKFYNRNDEITKLWNKIESGSNILISAPRRVGKTSIMYYLKDHPKAGYNIIYLITESVDNENEYYKKLYNHFLELFAGKGRKLINDVKRVASRIDSITKDGVKLGSEKINYYDEFRALVKDVDIEEKIVLMIDEFAQSVHNIVVNEGDRNAITFLKSNRTLRQDPEINNKIQFIYAGSIGLENIVNNLDSMQTINDLNVLTVSPLSKVDATDMIQQLMSNYVMKTDAVNYLIEKVKWLIPFYIQILLQEVKDMTSEDTEVCSDTIDAALDRVLEYRNYFEHWEVRLRVSYKTNEYKFTKNLLNQISENESIPSNEILDIAVKFDLKENYRQIIKSLKYDGYINNNDNFKEYRFNSPILRIWWRKNVAN